MPSAVRAAAIAVLVAVAGLAGCGGDDPAPPVERVVTVVQDDAELLHRSPARIAATLDDLRDLGVDWVRITAGWSVIAPAPGSRGRPSFDASDPEAYPDGAWDPLDRVARLAAERGLRLAVDVAFWAPRWAVRRPGARADRERERIHPADFADFAEAVARRYPDAAAFTVWNEPNHNVFLMPQWERDADGSWRPASPHVYREMLEAAVPRIERAAPGAVVLIGATSSVGSPRGDDRGDRMAPMTFVRELACVDERLEPLDRPECRGFEALPGDGFSHHPYSLDLPPWAPDPRAENVRMGDLDRLGTLLADLHARGRTRRRLPLYLTEYGYQTNPPDPTWEVTVEDQARWLPEAEQVARRRSDVRAVAQFLVRDLPERPGDDLRTRWRDYQSGLRFEDGRRKPAHSAFALGLTARRVAGGVRFEGLVRPGSGRRTGRIAVRDAAGAWRTLRDLRTEPDGTFALTADVDPDATWRLESGGRAGPPLAGARTAADAPIRVTEVSGAEARGMAGHGELFRDRPVPPTGRRGLHVPRGLPHRRRVGSVDHRVHAPRRLGWAGHHRRRRAVPRRHRDGGPRGADGVQDDGARATGAHRAARGERLGDLHRHDHRRRTAGRRL